MRFRLKILSVILCRTQRPREDSWGQPPWAQCNHTSICDLAAPTETQRGELGAAALTKRNHTSICDFTAPSETQIGELGAAALTKRHHTRTHDIAPIETQI